jgi:hypothetical protein
MDVKNLATITRPICGYYKGCKKNQQLFWNLYVGTTRVIKKPTIITKLICGYCKGYKKTNNYYETYMRVLQCL